MAVRFSTKGYNIGTMDISTELDDSQAVKIGTKDDFDMITRLAETGFAKIKFSLDSTDYNIGCLLNVVEGGIEFGNVTYNSASAAVISGLFYVSSNDLMCAISIDEISSEA